VTPEKCRLSNGVGSQLVARVEHLRSVTIYPEKLDLLTHIGSIIIVGGTCVGKSTIVRAVRESRVETEGLTCVPRRYVTRAPRLNDDPFEAAQISAGLFQQGVRCGFFGLSWARHMEDGRIEHYGLERPPAGRLPVYLGGNGLYDHPGSVSPRDALSQSLVVGIHAPDEVRRRRLVERSPDLIKTRPAEVAMRLGLGFTNMLPHIHVLIDNHGPYEGSAVADAVVLVEEVARLRGE
jgi:hypothetical protein